MRKWCAALAIALALFLGVRWARWYGDFNRQPLALMRAEALVRSGDWPQAATQLDAYMDYHPDNLHAVLLRAEVANAQQDRELAWELVHRIPVHHRFYPVSLYQLGGLFSGSDKLLSAEEVWRKCLELASTYGNIPLAHQVRSKLADLYTFQERKREAADLLWEVYPQHPNPWRVLEALLELELPEPRSEDEIELLTRFVESEPDDFYSRRTLAHRLAEVKRYPTARAHLEQCLATTPQDAITWLLLLEIALEQEQVDRAASLVEQMPDPVRSEPPAWRLRADLEIQRDNLAKALQIAKEGVESHPRDRDLLSQLANLSQRDGDQAAAARRAAELKKLQQARDSIELARDQLRQRGVHPEFFPDTQLCQQLSAGCQTLGLDRLAEAWRVAAVPSNNEAIR